MQLAHRQSTLARHNTYDHEALARKRRNPSTGRYEIYWRMPDAGIRSELLRADDAVKKATGASTKPNWRAPYGAGRYDPHILEIASSVGSRSTGVGMWTHKTMR